MVKSVMMEEILVMKPVFVRVTVEALSDLDQILMVRFQLVHS